MSRSGVVAAGERAPKDRKGEEQLSWPVEVRDLEPVDIGKLEDRLNFRLPLPGAAGIREAE